MSRKVTVIAAGLLLVVTLLAIFRSGQQETAPPAVKRTQLALGTFVEIEVRGLNQQAADSAIDSAFAEVLRIHDQYSPFNEDGPLWIINHNKASSVPITTELHHLLQVCDTISTVTEGAFDPCVEPLINLWKIWGENPVIPTDEDIAQAMLLCGWNKLEFTDDLILKREAGVMFSFGAVAKGYAVDRMIEILEEEGVQLALVNAGGEIRTLGDGWIVGIQHPSLSQELIFSMSLADNSVATSGDYEQFHEEKGRRYHHILNPATGYPATASHSVTVVAPTCIKADAYATGVFVLGPEKGMALVNSMEDLEAMLVDSSGTVHYSTGFEQLLQ
jgi:FAD:protein FMN transferase